MALSVVGLVRLEMQLMAFDPEQQKRAVLFFLKLWHPCWGRVEQVSLWFVQHYHSVVAKDRHFAQFL